MITLMQPEAERQRLETPTLWLLPLSGVEPSRSTARAYGEPQRFKIAEQGTWERAGNFALLENIEG